ncbi:MAG: nucleotide exchange factor GrpE [Pseudonocardiaceae bacterium]
MSDRFPADPSYGELQALQAMLFDAAEQKRAALKERDAQHREEIGRVMSAIIDVLDSIDRLLQDDASLQSWALVTRQFASALNASGLALIGNAGEMADPRTHRVIEARQSTESPDEMVLEVLRRGFRYQGRVMRPAEVVVATNPAPKPPLSGSDTTGTGDPGTGEAGNDQEQG